MIITDLFFAFLVAFLLSVLLINSLGWQRPGRESPWGGVLLLFTILFLTTWAGGVWITPFGPVLWHSYWLPFLVIGVIVALLFAAVSPPGRTRRTSPSPQEIREEVRAETALSAFFWILALVLVVSIVIHYVLV